MRYEKISRGIPRARRIDEVKDDESLLHKQDGADVREKVWRKMIRTAITHRSRLDITK